MTKVAFDVDGTLITLSDDLPRRDVIDNLIFLSTKCNCEITVWSGGGKEYADVWVRRLFLQRYVTHVQEKPIHSQREGLMPEGGYVDIAFDDEDVTFGKVNIKV